MTTRSHQRPASTLWQRALLAVASPIVFVLVMEGAIRISGLDTDLARNRNFEIAVPVWLLADQDWVAVQDTRLRSRRGVRAEDVAWLHHFEEARYVEYKLKPSIEVDAVNPFNDIEVLKGRTFSLRSNRDGFRTAELTPKAAGSFRIVTIGDSSTFGWGVDPDYTFQALLAERLADAGRPVEIVNLGIPGYTSRHGLGVLEHYGLALEPDLLILSFGVNDAKFARQPTDAILDRDDTWLGTARALLLRFDTFRLLRRLIFTLSDPIGRSRAAAADGQRPDLTRAVPRDDYIANLQSMVESGRRAGADSLLLAVCSPEEYVNGMRHVADVMGVPMVDALAIFEASLEDLRAGRRYRDEVAFYEQLYGAEMMASDTRLYVTTDGCHPGRAGHSLLADALRDALPGGIESSR